MSFDKIDLTKFGILGGILGGIIAIIGFWLLSPPTDSLVLFVILRIIIGSIVAMIIGSILIRLAKDKNNIQKKSKQFFDSLWFNAVMSVVSVGVLVERIITNYLSGDYYHEFILIIIWIVMVYHFVGTTIKAIGDKK